MSEILSVGATSVQDTSIIKQQFHTYSPYTSSFGKNDEVRITIHSQDLYVLPSESYILMEVDVTRKTGADHAAANGIWSANYPCYLFNEMRYELNNIEIDRSKNVGLSSYMKLCAAYPASDGREFHRYDHYTDKALEIQTYQFMIPLRFIFGFCEDYKKIIMNAKHELIMVINRQDIFAYTCATESFDLKISKIQWKMPHVTLADQAKLQMLRYVERQRSIHVPYRSWELHEMPQVPQATKTIWTVKSTSQANKPRFVLVTFQTNRNIVSNPSAKYDNCGVSDVKLFLNSECYPYDNFNTNFTTGAIQEAFHTFIEIQKSYYHGSTGGSPLNFTFPTYSESPIFAFDCSRTDDTLVGGTVDIRLEINSRANIPANTVANCLIIFDNYFEYSPFRSIVVKKP